MLDDFEAKTFIDSHEEYDNNTCYYTFVAPDNGTCSVISGDDVITNYPQLPLACTGKEALIYAPTYTYVYA